MQHSLCLLVVIATGIGKSILFILLVLVSLGSVTIVIVLLSLLQDNMLNYCN
jgi:superfamily II DNA helicase RecQ